MMRWATETRDAKGDLLLDAPGAARGDARENERLVPVRRKAAPECTVRRMQLLTLALMVVNVSGRRIGAISQLRRNDFNLNEESEYKGATILWRAEADKREREFSLPIPSYVAREIHGQLTRITW
jgi:hypothetical protein